MKRAASSSKRACSLLHFGMFTLNIPYSFMTMPVGIPSVTMRIVEILAATESICSFDMAYESSSVSQGPALQFPSLGAYAPSAHNRAHASGYDQRIVTAMFPN